MRNRSLVALTCLVVTEQVRAGVQQPFGFQLQEAPPAKQQPSGRNSDEHTMYIANQTGPNCGRPSAQLKVALVWTQDKHGSQHLVRLEYVSDRPLMLKRFQAPLLLTTDSGVKVKPAFMPFAMSVAIAKGQPNTVAMELFYKVKGADLDALAHANTVEGRLETPGGHCEFQLLADAAERVRSFLADSSARASSPGQVQSQSQNWNAQWERMADASRAFREGRYAEAEEHLKAALKEAEKFAPEDPRLATSLNNLAEFYGAQGKYAEAEPLYKRSLATLEKGLGPNHPDVAASLNNLAELYRAQRKYAEAEPLYKRSLAIWEKALGPDHPKVATTLEDYASLMRKMGRDAEAEKLEARAKAIRAKSTQKKPGN